MGTLAPRHFWLKGGMHLTVRTARLEDAPQILDLSRGVIREERYSISTPEEFRLTEEEERASIEKHLENPDRLLLVAEAEGHVVGLLGLESGVRQRLRHRATLHIGIAWAWRGKGVGMALMGCALDWATAHPYIEKVSLGVLGDNARALALYRRFGFQEEGRRPREVRRGPGEYVDDILMYRFVKELSAVGGQPSAPPG
ncbi:MAG: GNAT family N-acetyltransferase [Anaerolineae bacterium]